MSVEKLAISAVFALMTLSVASDALSAPNEDGQISARDGMITFCATPLVDRVEALTSLAAMGKYTHLTERELNVAYKSSTEISFEIPAPTDQRRFERRDKVTLDQGWWMDPKTRQVAVRVQHRLFELVRIYRDGRPDEVSRAAVIRQCTIRAGVSDWSWAAKDLIDIGGNFDFPNFDERYTVTIQGGGRYLSVVVGDSQNVLASARLLLRFETVPTAFNSSADQVQIGLSDGGAFQAPVRPGSKIMTMAELLAVAQSPSQIILDGAVIRASNEPDGSLDPKGPDG